MAVDCEKLGSFYLGRVFDAAKNALKEALANLMLTLPESRGRDFRPWVDPAEIPARRVAAVRRFPGRGV